MRRETGIPTGAVGLIDTASTVTSTADAANDGLDQFTGFCCVTDKPWFAAREFKAALRAGLAFMTLHFPDEVETNRLTIEAADPKSGTAEFKATAIRIEKLPSKVEA